MPTSINGWPVLDNGSSSLAVATVPGTAIRLRMQRDVLPLFLALAAEYGHTVAPLRTGECGAYAYRQAHAADAWSDHASGTAGDLNWGHEGAQGPSGGMATMTDKQIRACAAIKAKFGVVIWGGDAIRGGDYSQPRFWDPMHYAIRPGVTVAAVRAQIARMGIRPDGTVKPPIPPAPPYPGKPIGWPSPRSCSSGPPVATIQRALRVPVTALFNLATRNAVARWTLTHPGAALKDRVGLGAVGPALYASILTRYPA